MKKSINIDGVPYVRVDSVVNGDFRLFGMDTATIYRLREWFVETTGKEPDCPDRVAGELIRWRTDVRRKL